MQKSRRQIIRGIFVTSLIIAIVSHRIWKIVRKEERKLLLAESVTPSIVWDIKLPSDEFIGDLSQVGTYLVYALPDGKNHDALEIKVQRLDNGVVTEAGALDHAGAPSLPDPLIVGMSRLAKKEFRIEHDGERAIVAQYNIATGARGIIAKLPEQCMEFKTLQRLSQNFFALEGLCHFVISKEPFKRVMVLDFETRRLTYASGPLAKNMRFIALK